MENHGPHTELCSDRAGMLRARPEDSSRQLPADVNFAIDVPAIAEFLGQAGLAPRAADRTGSMAPEDLTTLAGDITVRISCWN